MPIRQFGKRRKASPRGGTVAPSPVPRSVAVTDTEDALRERVKELQCLYTVSSLSQRHFGFPEAFLQAVVECLPRAWHHPDFASSRLVAHGREYRCGPSRSSPWRIAQDIRVDGKTIGAVEVLYRKGVPLADGEAFLPEEHTLLQAVAERIGRDLSHMQMVSDLRDAHQFLRDEHRVVEETNITLRNVLHRVEEEKREASAAIVENIRRIVMPVVLELELAASERQKAYVALLRQGLQDICSPFLTQLVREHGELTPAEVAITAMIRNGLSTKEIARIRCIAPATIRRHRENIRRKLGLQNRKINLITYLRTAQPESMPSSPQATLPDLGESLSPDLLIGATEPVPARRRGGAVNRRRSSRIFSRRTGSEAPGSNTIARPVRRVNSSNAA